MVLLALLALVMLGVGFAFVPLYRLFCQQFGIPVPTVVSAPTTGSKVVAGTSDRMVTIRFVAGTGTMANGMPLPIKFAPVIYTQRVRLGEPFLSAYTATNPTGTAMDGVAVHMLYAMGGALNDPAPYVALQQCFCFEQQHYPADTTVQLPLSFTISPNLPPDVHTITFAYTLFEALPNDPRVKNHTPGTSTTLTLGKG